ncbi:MAG: hypothetical protein JW797_11525 [Bradymonadales bacterium]|nr:hypothetical protein [Bradymonadales bacterium]
MSRWAQSAVLVMLAACLPWLSASAQVLDLSGMDGGQMLDQAEEWLDQIDEAVTRVQELAERTGEQESDLSKMRCIREKLAALQGFQRLAQEAYSSLSALVSQGDVEGMRHQYTLISVASGRVENLCREANECLGEILTYAGDSQRAADIDEEIPDETDWTASDSANLTLQRITPGTPLPEVTPYQ